MSMISSDAIKRIAGFIILAAVAVSAFFTFSQKKEEERSITYSTSDAGDLKGQFSIALDSWIGYFPFRSPVFARLMRDEGYRVKIIDDRADYPGRMKMLKKGEIDFAVCTVDSYLLNGKSVNYPGTIVAIIDESKGGDAIVAWKDKFSNIDQLKKGGKFRMAYTPSSPSEHLIKSIAVHFGIPVLEERKGEWRIEVDGAEEAYNRLMSKEADLAAVWEPHVTEALLHKGIVKIIGSEDIEKLIVDILIVNRKFAREKPEMVKLFLKNYFKTLNLYAASRDRLLKDISSKVNLNRKQAGYMLKGVKWLYYPDNIRWFGLTSRSTHRQPEIIETINSTVSILVNSRDFSDNPLTDKDPYTILNSSFIKELYISSVFNSSAATVSEDSTLSRKFSKLSDSQWEKLTRIGALKLRAISFRSGTSVLDGNGKEQVKNIVDNIRHYPNFRILIKGHTGLRGNPAANRALSLKRAMAVRDELQYTFNIHKNRIRVVGMGSREPLLKNSGESDRGYNTRLKRVEILFLSQ
jgi:outer membrane protein OmpA-like peptidoglycan-associated protein/ABC-type nitrate/sulfonate/bicarbonate transport system substrate-binding protein